MLTKKRQTQALLLILILRSGTMEQELCYAYIALGHGRYFSCPLLTWESSTVEFELACTFYILTCRNRAATVAAANQQVFRLLSEMHCLSDDLSFL